MSFKRFLKVQLYTLRRNCRVRARVMKYTVPTTNEVPMIRIILGTRSSRYKRSANIQRYLLMQFSFESSTIMRSVERMRAANKCSHVVGHSAWYTLPMNCTGKNKLEECVSVSVCVSCVCVHVFVAYLGPGLSTWVQRFFLRKRLFPFPNSTQIPGQILTGPNFLNSSGNPI